LDNVEEIKILVCSNHNRAEEVKACVEEELTNTQLIRLGADWDLM
jgi:hypothetical protein